MSEPRNDYELHVTVKADDLERFRADCAKIGVKPIVLDLQDYAGGSVMQDVMTSSKFTALPKRYATELNLVVEELQELGYEVVRTKVEAAPYNPVCPSEVNDIIMRRGQYFEAHFRVLTREDRLERLREHCECLDAHLSKNIFKKDGAKIAILVTYRHYRGTIEGFQDMVDLVGRSLKHKGFEVDKTEVEFVVYDSNGNHDDAWTGLAQMLPLVQ